MQPVKVNLMGKKLIKQFVEISQQGNQLSTRGDETYQGERNLTGQSSCRGQINSTVGVSMRNAQEQDFTRITAPET
jgi:hypothetical protein